MNKKNEMKKKYDKFNIVAILIIISFFSFLLFYYGVGFYPDSQTYIQMGTDREPGYCILINLCIFLFQKNGFFILALIQNMLAAFVTIVSFFFFTKLVNKNLLFSILILGSLLVPHIMTPLASTSNLVFTNSMLSEGIVYSLYLLFFVCLCKSIMLAQKKERIKYVISTILLSYCLSITRSQLMYTIIVWAIVYLIFNIGKKKWRNLLWIFCMVIVVFGFKTFTIKSYHYVVNDRFINNTGGNSSLLTNLLYATNLELTTTIKNQQLQPIYNEIRTKLLENKLNAAFAQKGIVNQIQYHEYCHDRIKFDTIDLPIYYAVKEKGFKNPVDSNIEEDKIVSQLTKELLPQSIKQFIPIYCNVAIGGLIRTVAFIHPLMNWYTILIYIFAIVLTIFGIKNAMKTKKTSAGLIIMALALLSIIGNVSATSLFIMCLSRYVIYNTSIFYIGILIMMWEIYNIKKDKHRRKENKNGI